MKSEQECPLLSTPNGLCKVTVTLNPSSLKSRYFTACNNATSATFTVYLWKDGKLQWESHVPPNTTKKIYYPLSLKRLPNASPRQGVACPDGYTMTYGVNPP